MTFDSSTTFDGSTKLKKFEVWLEKRDAATPAQPGPPIASLSEDWRTRIETVRQKAAKEIATYTQIWRSIDTAENANNTALLTIASECSPKHLQGRLRSQEAKAEALEDIKQKQYADMLRARQDIEWQIASEFAPELVALCRKKNPKAYDALTANHGDSKMMPLILGLLYYDVYYDIKDLPLGSSTTLPLTQHSADENTPSVSKHPMDTALPNTSTDADAGSPAVESAYDRSHVSAERLQAFEQYHIGQHRLSRKSKEIPCSADDTINREALASLANTLDSIWEETIHPRIQQPDKLSFPHVYSVVEELVGHKHRVPRPAPCTKSTPTPVQIATAQHFLPTVLEPLSFAKTDTPEPAVTHVTKQHRIVTPRTDIDDPSLPTSNSRF